jgi:uncharacterized protein YuzE
MMDLDQVAEQLRAEHRAFIERIVAANQNLADLLSREPLTLEWDAEGDILYLTLGKPRESTTENLTDCAYIRVDPETLELHGLEFHYATEQLEEFPHLRKSLQAAARLTKTPLDRLPPALAGEDVPADAATVAQSLRELVSAR